MWNNYSFYYILFVLTSSCVFIDIDTFNCKHFFIDDVCNQKTPYSCNSYVNDQNIYGLPQSRIINQLQWEYWTITINNIWYINYEKKNPGNFRKNNLYCYVKIIFQSNLKSSLYDLINCCILHHTQLMKIILEFPSFIIGMLMPIGMPQGKNHTQ